MVKLIPMYGDRIIPFSEPGDDNDINFNKGKRVQIVRDFIGMDLQNLKTLDIGAPNAFGKLLGIKDNTLRTDLNDELHAPDKDYDLILFSEILEHLMNPLMALRSCHDLLKPGGILIVSTPTPNRFFIQSPSHLTEYRPDRLVQMLRWAGFEVLDYKKFCIWDKRFMFYGIRPFLRVLFHRSQLWKLRKCS